MPKTMPITGPTKSSDLLANLGNNERTATYLADLSRKRRILAQITCEEPQTPPRPPFDDAEHEERVNALRERVRGAWAKADGNPADGQWEFLSRLLRMGVTSGHGGRWTGARMDIEPAVEFDGDNLRWINAETESEWKEWELRDREERILRDKVESWKKLVAQQTSSSVGIPPSEKLSAASSSNLQNASDPPTASQSRPTSTGAKMSKVKTTNLEADRSTALPSKPVMKAVVSTIDPLKGQSPFGFSVVKGPSQKSSAGKPGGPAKLKLSEPQKGSPFPASQPNECIVSGNKPDNPPISTRDTDIRHIADGSSFLSPSFSSSAIVTSTPKPETTAKSSTSRKPNSMSHTTPQSQYILPSAKPFSYPSTSPSLEKAHGHQTNVQASSFLMMPPASRTRNLHHHLPSKLTPGALSSNANTATKNRSSSGTNANNKRPRLPRSASPTSLRADGNADRRALKRARTLSGLTAGPSRMKTPPIHLPVPYTKITAHVVSTPLPPFGEAGDAEPQLDSPLEALPSTPKRKPVPTLTELLATSKKGKWSSPSRRALSRRQFFTPSEDINVAEMPAKPRPSPFMSPPRRFPDAASVIDPYADDADFEAIIAANAAPHSPPNDPYNDPYDPYAYDIPVDSPAKSLSSLAGSESEGDDDDGHEHDFAQAPVFGGLSPDFVFKPEATSTQQGPLVVGTTNVERQDSWASVYGPAANGNSNSDADPTSRPPASSGSLYPAYNSQFEADVARKVNAVSQLLERDVDYGGWLRDPSPAPHPGLGLDESP